MLFILYGNIFFNPKIFVEIRKHFLILQEKNRLNA